MYQELEINTQRLSDHHWFWRLRPFAHKLFRIPGLNMIRPLAAQAAAVATPAGKITFKRDPEQTWPESPHLTVLSANLYHDWPRFRHQKQRLEAIAQIIETETADIILLQEVTRTPHFHSDKWLANRLGMAYVYARANGHETGIGFEEGLAIFSRFPLSQPMLTELGREQTPFTRRLVLAAQVNLSTCRLPIFSAHLALTPKKNAAQLAHLHNWVHEIAGADLAIIGGDFNAHETTPQIVQAQKNWIDTFRHLHPQVDGTTHELRWPWGQIRRQRLDYLFLHGEKSRWQTLETRHVIASDTPHSDHHAVLARVKPACGYQHLQHLV